MGRITAIEPSLLQVHVQRLPHAEGLALPSYQTDDAAGADVLAAVPESAPIMIEPGARALVPTGLVVALPPGTEAQVRPRSGLALKHGVSVLNAPGTIDADYRGEVGVILINHGAATFEVRRGDRIAQIVFAAVTRATFKEVDVIDTTERGAGGFGSTGAA